MMAWFLCCPCLEAMRIKAGKADPAARGLPWCDSTPEPRHAMGYTHSDIAPRTNHTARWASASGSSASSRRGWFAETWTSRVPGGDASALR
eukprot:10031078-Alexandrium_andersonii.AAC.1